MQPSSRHMKVWARPTRLPATTMAPGVRKLALALHLTVSVGWIGAIAAYISLDVTATTANEVGLLRAAYLGMDAIARFAIVPLAVAALLTGLVVSLGTRWGLFRHWWVLVSLLLTIFATVVLLVETQSISAFAVLAADAGSSRDELRALGGTLLHSVGGMAVLLVVLVLNVFKPRGLTPYGWRKQQEEKRGLHQRT